MDACPDDSLSVGVAGCSSSVPSSSSWMIKELTLPVDLLDLLVGTDRTTGCTDRALVFLDNNEECDLRGLDNGMPCVEEHFYECLGFEIGSEAVILHARQHVVLSAMGTSKHLAQSLEIRALHVFQYSSARDRRHNLRGHSSNKLATLGDG